MVVQIFAWPEGTGPRVEDEAEEHVANPVTRPAFPISAG
jgi:hypothetical protein